MKCKRCQGGLEPIHRLGKVIFWFCRGKDCKIPYDESGAMIVEPGTLSSHLNPLVRVREFSQKLAPGMQPVARTALEAVMLNFMLEIYQAGIKDGILLSFDRDFVRDDPPPGVTG